MARLTPVHAAAACVAYPLCCHAAVALQDARWAAVGLAVMSWAVLCVGRGTRFAAAIGVLVLGAALAAAAAVPAILVHAPPVALNAALCVLFGASLRGGREPTVSRFARAERGGSLPDDLARYTRVLTGLWSAFFAAMALTSLSLALWSSALAWSIFTNVANYVMVVLFFVAEYAYRRIRYRHHQHLSPAQIVRRLHAYRVLSP